ncbi:hypothetical protein HY522_03670, partial [bacterium]|nr:hypothetical protein [bacterium]
SMNPVIKFTTLFGLLAAELAVAIKYPAGSTLANPSAGGSTTTLALAAVFVLISVLFVYRSFYGMRITRAEN